MKASSIIASTIFLWLFLFSGCTEKNCVSVPDSYNGEGRELIYAPERVEGENCSSSFLKFGSEADFQKAIDDAIEKGQKKFGEEYIALADIIAWYEITNYVVYSTHCAKVTGWPARFASDKGDSFTFTIENLPKIFDGKPVYYHSSMGIENDLTVLIYTVKVINIK